MILTCPFCTMRYIVSDGSIGPNGRKVRCASCGHEWQQAAETGLDEALFGPAAEPEDYTPVSAQESADMESDLSFMSSAPFEDTPPPSFVKNEEEPADFGSMLKREMKEDISIPEGVKPKNEEIILPAARKKMSLGSRGGYIAAGLFYLVLFTVFLLLQPQISRVWPASNLVYGWFGLSPSLPGEGLALDGLEAKIANNQIIMTGSIINLTGEPVKVPAVMAMIVDENDETLEKVLIVPPSDIVEAEGQIGFDVTYPSVPTGALNVNFAFTYVKPKKVDAVEDDETPQEKTEDVTSESSDAGTHHEAPDTETAEPSHSEH